MKAKVLLAALGIFALTGSAWACNYETFEADADCYGWTASGSNEVCGSRDTLGYVVNLKQDGMIIATFSGSIVVWAADPFWSLDVPWGMELCGDYVAEGHFYYISPADITDYRDFTIPFTCECGGECTYTPGYWKNHPEAWPVSELEVGGITYTQFQLLQIFDLPTKGDITIILFHHLVAAKLNVLSGSSASIQATIDAADAYLMDYPLFSKPEGEAKDMGEDLKDILADYNEIPCPDDDMDDLLGASPRALESAPATTESSWGALKKKTQ